METLLWIGGLVVYGLIFIGLSFRFTAFPLIAIFACAPIPTDISGGWALKFSLAEVNILLSFLVLLLKRRRLYGGAIVGLAMVYIGVALMCSISDFRSSSIVALFQTCLYLVAVVMVFAALARSEEDFRPCFHVFIATCLFLAVSLVVKVSPWVWGIHKNNCGSAIAAAYLMTLELSFNARNKRLRLLYQIAMIVLGCGLMMTLSRGAWLSAVVGTLVVFFLRRRFALMLRATVVMGVVVAACWAYLPEEHKEYAVKVKATDWNIMMRYQSKDFALHVFRQHPLLGAGVGLRKEYDATNLFFLLLAESGVVGLLAFAIHQVAIGGLIWKTHREIAQRDFAFSILVIAAAIMTAKLTHGMVDHYWVRGTLTAAWGSVGMSIYVARVTKARHLQQAKQRERPDLRLVAGPHHPLLPA